MHLVRTVLSIIIILAISLSACHQQANKKSKSLSKTTPIDSQELKDAWQTILNKDKQCLEDLASAQKDFAEGRLAFIHEWGFLYRELRQMKYLPIFLKKYHLVYQEEVYSDVVIEGQTQGCYAAYMNLKLAEKYGPDFKQRILDLCDSMLLLNNDTINNNVCDKQAFIKGKSKHDNDLIIQLPAELKTKLKTDPEGKYPFMDIDLLIDKQGHTSQYELNYFYDARHTSNAALEDQLYQYASRELKAIQTWEAAEIHGQKVNSFGNIRVFF